MICERQDEEILGHIGDNNGDADRMSEKVQESKVTNTSWNIVSQEYGGFHKRVKTFTKWDVLLLGITFASVMSSSRKMKFPKLLDIIQKID